MWLYVYRAMGNRKIGRPLPLLPMHEKERRVRREISARRPARKSTRRLPEILNPKINDSGSSLANLFYLSLSFERREIPRRCCVGDVQQLLYFVVGDFGFLIQLGHDLFQLHGFTELDGCAGFHEEVASETRWGLRLRWLRYLILCRRNRLRFGRQRLVS